MRRRPRNERCDIFHCCGMFHGRSLSIIDVCPCSSRERATACSGSRHAFVHIQRRGSCNFYAAAGGVFTPPAPAPYFVCPAWQSSPMRSITSGRRTRLKAEPRCNRRARRRRDRMRMRSRSPRAARVPPDSRNADRSRSVRQGSGRRKPDGRKRSSVNYYSSYTPAGTPPLPHTPKPGSPHARLAKTGDPRCSAFAARRLT
jgi:hypothetical protein